MIAGGIFFEEFEVLHDGPMGAAAWPLFIIGLILVLSGLALIAPVTTEARSEDLVEVLSVESDSTKQRMSGHDTASLRTGPVVVEMNEFANTKSSLVSTLDDAKVDASHEPKVFPDPSLGAIADQDVGDREPSSFETGTSPDVCQSAADPESSPRVDASYDRVDSGSSGVDADVAPPDAQESLADGVAHSEAASPAQTAQTRLSGAPSIEPSSVSIATETSLARRDAEPGAANLVREQI